MSHPTKPPMIARRMMNRLVIGLFSIALLIFAWNVLKNIFIDPDFGSMNSVGYLASIVDTKNGTQAVMLKPNGQILRSPGYTDGNQDQDIVWQPDGNRLYFSSDRDQQKAFHIYRWNPAENVAQDRSIGSRSQQKPEFPMDHVVAEEQNFLAVSGGIVVDFNPKTATTRQQIPLVTRDPTQVAGGQGVGSQFGPEFDHLGTSFRSARWCDHKKYIVGVMERQSGGETLVLQNMQPNSLQGAMPQPIIAADHIDFTIDPKNGDIVYCVENWKLVDSSHVPKQFLKGNQIVGPFTTALIIFDPNAPEDPSKSGVVIAFKGNKVSLGMPAVSPGGSRVAFCYGSYDSGLSSKGMIICPLTPGGGRGSTPLVKGPVYSPCWSPDGKLIAFTQTGKTGDSDIWTINSDGSNLQDLTNGSGNFTDISYSPQMAKQSSQ